MCRLISLVCVLFVAFSVSCGFDVVNRRCLGKKHNNCQFDSHGMELWCDDSNITEIPQPESMREFAPVAYAKAMYMNNSCMENINTVNLQKYRCLRLLDFDNNYISFLPESPFSQCGKLEILKLAKNNLTAIKSNSFVGLKALLELRLDGNQILDIESGALDDVMHLRVLTLNDNQISYINGRMFEKLFFLQRLDLSGNSLKQLTIWHLRGLAQLTSLNLRNNQLTSIDKIVFVSTPRLQEIDLRNNSVTCLEYSMFSKTDVASIKLSNNKLQIPKPEWFRKLCRQDKKEMNEDVPSLTANNLWHCGCDAIAFLRYLKYEIAGLDWWVSRLDVQCASPPEFEGKWLSTLSEEMINNHHNKSCSLLNSKKHYCESDKSSTASRTTVSSNPKVRSTTTTSTTTTTITSATSLVPNFPSLSAESAMFERPPPDMPFSAKFSWNEWHTVVLVCSLLAFTMLVSIILILWRCRSTKKKRNGAGNTRNSVISNRSEPDRPFLMANSDHHDYLQPSQELNHAGQCQCHCQNAQSCGRDDRTYYSIQEISQTVPKTSCGDELPNSHNMLVSHRCSVPNPPSFDNQTPCSCRQSSMPLLHRCCQNQSRPSVHSAQQLSSVDHHCESDVLPRQGSSSWEDTDFESQDSAA